MTDRPAAAPRSAMVLAAGFGTRMGALTATRPKPLLEVAGRTLIDRTLDHVAEAGVARAVVNLHYLGAQIRAHLTGRSGPEVLFSPEAELLDTGGGLRQARALLGRPEALVMNSDAVFAGPNPLSCLPAGLGEGLDACLLMVPREAARAYSRSGDFFPDGAGLRRRGEAAAAPLVYTGVQLIRLSVLDDTPDGAFSMNHVWDRLIAAGRIGHALYPGEWVDVGTPAGITTAEAALAEAGP